MQAIIQIQQGSLKRHAGYAISWFKSFMLISAIMSKISLKTKLCVRSRIYMNNNYVIGWSVFVQERFEEDFVFFLSISFH